MARFQDLDTLPLADFSPSPPLSGGLRARFGWK